MPQGQNDFHHANVDQTVLFEPKDTIVERDPIVQTLPENNLTIKDIVEHLKHEYKRYGEELLHKLSMFPNDFKFDKNGLISIDDNKIPGNIGKKCKSLHSLKSFYLQGHQFLKSCLLHSIQLVKKILQAFSLGLIC